MHIKVSLQHSNVPRHTVYWPKLQDDISEMVQKCDECQRYGNKKPRPPERQISATRPLALLGVELVQFQRQQALVTVDYYSGFLTYDTLSSETTEAVTKALNNIFRKFGLPERIISDNGPCFKSEKFQCFCDQFDIGQVTSSPYHHKSNEWKGQSLQLKRFERRVQVILT